eukprot:scaffold57533_cov22-Tisochrysis_lutea.AAC.2
MNAYSFSKFTGLQLDALTPQLMLEFTVLAFADDSVPSSPIHRVGQFRMPIPYWTPEDIGAQAMYLGRYLQAPVTKDMADRLQ